MQKEYVLIHRDMVAEFRVFLRNRENAEATISKYLRDINTFLKYCGKEGAISKEVLLSYKAWLLEHYSVNSVNSMLAALNQFLSFLNLEWMKLKRVRVQCRTFQNVGKELKKEDFQLLVRSAKKQGKTQLAMIMETLCATGIRVSELKFFRVETIRGGVVKVWNKGKYRMVLLPHILRKKLLTYIKKEKIRSGPIFRTRTGKEKDRSNIWKEMKDLAKCTGIGPEKVFPHNLRHLFARCFYQTTGNLLNLADILGHSNLEVTRIYASDGIAEWQKNMELVRLLEH